MGHELRDILKLCAGMVLSAAALRFIWKRLFSVDRQQRSIGGPLAAAPLLKGVQSNGVAVAAAGKELEPDAGVWIYFGSQSGTAEGFSKELEQEGAEHELKSSVVDLEDFDPDKFVKHKVVVLVLATYGEGDPTDNAVEFFKWLKDDILESDALKGTKYCVMGLGNRQYVNFNSCGKLADQRMEELGATRVYDLGIGDDDQNIEEDFEQWKENGLWPALRKACGQAAPEAPHEASGAHAVPSAAQVVASLPLKAEVQEDARKLPVDPLVQVGGSDILGKWYFQSNQAPVIAERELRQVPDVEAGKSTKHIDIDVKHIPALDWRTADNLEVLPRNPDETVAWFAERLGVSGQLESSLGFVRAPGVERPVKKPFPTPCTVKDALGAYCDLCQAPSKQVVKKLASFIRSEDERDAVLKLVEDRSAYHWLTGEGVRSSFREIFELFFASAEIDLGTFLQLCPRQKSRPYTIASSSREDRHTIGLCVSVVAEALLPLADIAEGLRDRGHPAPGAAACLERFGDAGAKAPRNFRGVCSSMLCCHTAVGDRLWIGTRPSTFRLPRKVTTPIIMVGAGTGIAPFRGFVREFRAEGGTRKSTTLFFGCTKSAEDFLYRDELQEAVGGEPKVLGELVTAFSREQKEKVYVQHQLKQRATDVVTFLNQGAYLYVCGSVAMGAAIREEIAAALGSPDHMSRLQTEGRYVEELW